MHYLAYFFRLHRASLVAVSISIVLLTCVVIIGINHLRITHNNVSQIKTAALPTPVALKQSEVLIQSLPNSSTDIAELIHREAENAQITIEEISYESREEHDLPVVLRSASFNLTNNYTTIRHYLDSVVHAQTNLTLDALDCTRDDISSREVNCVITVSAYQRYNPAPAEGNHVR
jgi:hypothetical protein